LSEELPEPPRQVAHFALLILVGFTIAGSVILSGRAVTLASFNNVAPGGPAPRALTPVSSDDWTVIIHRSDWKPPIAKLLGRDGAGQPPRLGWIVREWSFLSLPLVAYRQSDLAVFREDGYGYRLSGLMPDQIAAMKRSGQPPWFPWWRYTWGWLAVAAVAGFAWAELRWQAKRRQMLGLI
jgi:hypothetical protein